MWGGSNGSLQNSTNNVPTGESQRTNRKAGAFPKSAGGKRARVGSRVNLCECLINIVINNKLKAHGIGLSQNGKAVGTGSQKCPVMGK